jgi:hypothetical protein
MAHGTGPLHNSVLEVALEVLLFLEVTVKLSTASSLKVRVRPLFTPGETEVHVGEELVKVSDCRGGCTNPIAQPLTPCTPIPNRGLCLPVWSPDYIGLRG